MLRCGDCAAGVGTGDSLMTLQADLEKLGSMSNSLHDLGNEAFELSAGGLTPWILEIIVGSPADTPLGRSVSMLRSVAEANELALGVEDTLIPVVAGRLHEIANLMRAAAVLFRIAEGANSAELAELYTTGSGDWGAK
jgi:hypothetical protein